MNKHLKLWYQTWADKFVINSPWLKHSVVAYEYRDDESFLSVYSHALSEQTDSLEWNEL